MDEKAYFKAVALVERRYQEDLKTVERMWRIHHPGTPVPERPSETSKRIETMAEHGIHTVPVISNGFILSMAFREALAEIPANEDISQPVILKRILAKHPEVEPRIKPEQFKPQIAGMLTRMWKGKKLNRVKEGHGSEPAVYRKIMNVAETA